MVSHYLYTDQKKCATALYGSEEIISILIKYGARINTINIYGYTSLHSAAIANQTANINLLLKYNANINTMNMYGEKPTDFLEIKKNIS